MDGYKGHAPFIDNSGAEITQVHYRPEDIVSCALAILERVRMSHDLCLDKWGPSAVLGSPVVRNAFENAARRGAKIRLITEVSEENMEYCKEFSSFAEVRHLDKVKGNFSVSDAKWYTASAVADRDQPPKRLIVSNVDEIAEQHQYFFETLWDKAVPLDDRKREIETGLVPQRTAILESAEDTARHLKDSIESSSWLAICSSLADLRRIHDLCSSSLEKVLKKHRAGGHRGVRWIGNIEEKDLQLVRHYVSVGMEVRHSRKVPLTFLVTDKEFNFTVSNVELQQQGDSTPSVLTSNELPYIRQFNSLFAEIWGSGIDAEERIRQIEEGYEFGDISVIRNAPAALDTYKKLIMTARSEIMILFPSQNAMARQYEAGIADLLKERLSQPAGSPKIRLIVPHQALSGDNSDVVGGGGGSSGNGLAIGATLLTGNYKNLSMRSIREIETSYKATVVVADSNAALMMEQKDDEADAFDGAIGLSTFSESRPGVMSYASIFESLWTQTELYDQVKQANEQLELALQQLKEHDRMQREFINIAAHELRTPVQPLLGIADILSMEASSSGGGKVVITKDDLDLIIRNSKRLERLSSDILQVTRIESKKLELHKERINLNDEIRSVIGDVENSLSSTTSATTTSSSPLFHGRKLGIIFEPHADPIMVQVDRSRIFEVLANLIDNAVKFTGPDGRITVTSEIIENRGAMVKVIDPGRGIDPEIFPRLFTKFATKSDKGTGLGLYISKSIVQAHGGDIWAENNGGAGQKGATFTFTLPLAA
ncbi:MAG TPA: HAMP domain-containing sensor histidine kinase [Nitrososphaera sp.]|nr:HAMP domain-containing sensor histidine kinase [Nitrososphaera sp.]